MRSKRHIKKFNISLNLTIYLNCFLACIFNIKFNKRGANFHVNITVRDNKAYLHAHNGLKSIAFRIRGELSCKINYIFKYNAFAFGDII